MAFRAGPRAALALVLAGVLGTPAPSLAAQASPSAQAATALALERAFEGELQRLGGGSPARGSVRPDAWLGAPPTYVPAPTRQPAVRQPALREPALRDDRGFAPDPRYALRGLVERLGAADTAVAAFYTERGFQPLWLTARSDEGARRLVAQLSAADDDNLNPAAYRPDRLAALIDAASPADPAATAEAELALTRAYLAYARDMKRGAAPSMAFSDPQLPSEPDDPRARLQAAADAPSLADHVANLASVNPIYDSLREALLDSRGGHLILARDNGPSGAAAEALIRINMERARALPRFDRDRFILVDAAAAQLWLYENGRVTDTMKVVVGKPAMPTPVMAGLVRFALYNPYWNVPEDLNRTSIAPKVLQQGLGYLTSEGMEVLSDWSDNAVKLDPAKVDWQGVAAGRVTLRIRQRPGEKNMMGAVKLMLPNPLGIYLHDTPNKGAFELSERLLSSGCVRLEDALRLANHLAGDAARGVRAGGEEQQVDLPRPVPVYITYLTAVNGPGGVRFRTDIYGRDPPLMKKMVQQASRGAPAPTP